MERFISCKKLWWLFFIFTAIWFSNLEYRKLIKPDEGRYAEIPREMVASGDWTTPRLNDLKYFEKPPLQYWATAAAYEVFGEHNWTSRLWDALTGFMRELDALPDDEQNFIDLCLKRYGKVKGFRPSSYGL